MTEVQEAKKAFVERGQINKKIVSDEIMLSWQKCRLLGMHPSWEIRSAGVGVIDAEGDFYDYCDRVVPEHISYFLTDEQGRVRKRRASFSELRVIDNLSDNFVGSTSFAVAKSTKKMELVRGEEHYLEALSDFTSATLPFAEQSLYLTLFFLGRENAVLLAGISDNLEAFIKNKGIGSTKTSSKVRLSDYINENEYEFRELLDRVRAVNTELPLYLIGRDADAVAWYFSDRRRELGLRISHRGIPDKFIEDKLIDYSAKSDCLIIGDVADAPERYLSLIIQIVDFVMDKDARSKKRIIITATSEPADKRLSEKLIMTTIDLDKFLKKGALSIDTKSLEEVEKAEIERTLLATNGNVAKAAKMLGIGRATLYRKLKVYQIER